MSKKKYNSNETFLAIKPTAKMKQEFLEKAVAAELKKVNAEIAATEGKAAKARDRADGMKAAGEINDVKKQLE